MEPTHLLPPNYFELRDTVVGNVMHRPRTTRRKAIASIHDTRQDTGHTQRKLSQPRGLHIQTPCLESERAPPIVDEPRQVPLNAAMMSTVAELVGETDSSTGRKRFSSDLKTANEIIASIHGSSYEITDELQNAIVTETLKRKNRIRENRRTYQARYREKKIKIEKEIQNNVRNLRYEIGKLRQKRSAISHFPSPPMIWSIATEYLRLFNHYISTPAAMQSTASNFLHNILAPDVMVGTLFGMNSLLDHWKMFALFFDDPQLELKGMHIPTSDTLVTDFVVSVTITMNTLQRAFPHLVTDTGDGRQGGSQSTLTARLLGQRLVMNGTKVFAWDKMTEKVVRFHFQADMITPMIGLLNDLVDVAFVFNSAFVTPDCRFVRSMSF